MGWLPEYLNSFYLNGVLNVLRILSRGKNSLVNTTFFMVNVKNKMEKVSQKNRFRVILVGFFV